MSKTKLVRVTAFLTEAYEVTVKVPDHVDPDEVMEWYRDNGAWGEFELSGDPEWDWGEAELVDEPTTPTSDLSDMFTD